MKKDLNGKPLPSPNKTLNIDYEAYQALKRCAAKSNGKTFKTIINEVVMMASHLLNEAPVQTEHVNRLRMSLHEARKLYHNEPNLGYRSVVISRDLFDKLKRLAFHNDLKYGQFIRALLPIYETVHVMHMDEPAAVKQMVKDFQLNEPQQYNNVMRVIDGATVSNIVLLKDKHPQQVEALDAVLTLLLEQENARRQAARQAEEEAFRQQEARLKQQQEQYGETFENPKTPPQKFSFM